MDLAIEVRGLHKSFGATPALRGVDLEVPAGSVLGLLGPNGAGKTTLVRILATLLDADRGTLWIDGCDVRRDPRAVRSRIALAGQTATVDELLTGRENLVLLGRLLHLGRRASRERAAALLDRFDLTAAADRPVRTWSGGMRRRLDLASCLVGRPRVLFLDEPTTGLDPAARLELWATVRELVDEGVTVLLTTQYLEEADQLAEQVVVVAGGVVVAEGHPAELKRRAGRTRAEITVAVADLPSARAAVGAPADTVAGTGGLATITVPLLDDTGGLSALVLALDTHGVPVVDLAVHRPSLDDAFLALLTDPAVEVARSYSGR